MTSIALSVRAKIVSVRGQGVMLDSDLAALYEVETKALLQQVRRNPKRFPADFMFQLVAEEWEDLRSQFVTSRSSWGGRRSPPFAFTEHGVAMLSSVLRSERAIAVNVEIMRAFVALRHGARDLEEVTRRLDELERMTGSKLKAHERQLAEILAVLRGLTEPTPKPRHPIGFRVESDD